MTFLVNEDSVTLSTEAVSLTDFLLTGHFLSLRFFFVFFFGSANSLHLTVVLYIVLIILGNMQN